MQHDVSLHNSPPKRYGIVFGVCCVIAERFSFLGALELRLIVSTFTLLTGLVPGLALYVIAASVLKVTGVGARWKAEATARPKPKRTPGPQIARGIADKQSSSQNSWEIEDMSIEKVFVGSANDRFPALSSLAVLLRAAGWLGAVVSIVAIGIVISTENNNSLGGGFALIGGCVGLPVSIFFIVIGEMIGVLFAIEENTRRAALNAVELVESATATQNNTRKTTDAMEEMLEAGRKARQSRSVSKPSE